WPLTSATACNLQSNRLCLPLKGNFPELCVTGYFLGCCDSHENSVEPIVIKCRRRMAIKGGWPVAVVFFSCSLPRKAPKPAHRKATEEEPLRLQLFVVVFCSAGCSREARSFYLFG